MAVINLLGQEFFREMERDVVASVGVSLVKNGKVVTARTVKSVRAATTFNGERAEFEAYGGGGLPFIVQDKPANTKLPVVFVGTRTGRGGREVKEFELVAPLRDWKNVVGFGGSDFLLARAIAKNPRKAVDIATAAFDYLNKKTVPKIAKRFGSLLARELVNPFKDGN